MPGRVPNSTINLYSVPDIDVFGGQVYTFASEQERDNFFTTYLVASNVNCTVVKKRYQEVKVTTPLATLETCNYLSFVNPDYGDKVFYCVIRNTDYQNNDTCVVQYEIDWWHTDLKHIHVDPSRLSREGLTVNEYPSNMMVDGGSYGAGATDADGLFEKMTSPEPLAADSSVEPNYYDVATEASNINVEKGLRSLSVFGRGLAYSNLSYNNNPLVGICFTPPDYDKLGEEIWKQMAHIIKDIRSTTRYIVKTPYSLNTINVNPESSQYETYSAYFKDPDSGSYYLNDANATGYSKYPVSGSSQTSTFTTFTSLGSGMALPYVQIVAEFPYIRKIIDHLNSLDMVSAILGVHAIPIPIFDLLAHTDIYNTVSGTSSGASGYNIVNRFAKGMYFPMTKEYAGTTFSPKLCYFPYSYMSLETSDGNNYMEYKYEYIMPDPTKDSDGHDFSLTLGAKYDTDGLTYTAAPVAYKQRFGGHNWSAQSALQLDANPKDIVSDNNWSQVPYTTDAFIQSLAANSNKMIRENTLEFQNEMGIEYLQNFTTKNKAQGAAIMSLIDVVGDTASGIATGGISGGLTGALGAGNKAMARKSEAMQADLALQNTMLRANMHDAATKSKGASLIEGNPVYDNFAATKSAYAQPNYHSGTSIRPGMLVGVGERGFVATFHTLRSDIKFVYDKFFKMFGYATRQFKVPSIFEYISNGTAGKKPHFETLEMNDNRTVKPSGQTSYSRQVFYTQTDGIKLSGVNKESEDFIRTLLDSGCLFMKPLASELPT